MEASWVTFQKRCPFPEDESRLATEGREQYILRGCLFDDAAVVSLRLALAGPMPCATRP